MDDNIADIIIVGIIGITIMVSLVSLAVTRMVQARRRREADGPAIEARLRRIEEAIDAMAGEVQRVSEGQRFTTRLLAEREGERQAR